MDIHCRRCGECCRHTSPTLHYQDIELIHRGVVSVKDLYTLRPGQRVYDNIRQRPSYLEDELIKVKERPGTRQCIFYNPLSVSCSIYQQRPTQCRVFFCERPELLKGLFSQKKPTRQDIINDAEMLKIIDAHNRRVDMRAFVRKVESLRGEIDEALAELILYDLHFRDFIHERLRIPRQELSFYFGRPLSEILKDHGLELEIRV